MFFSRSRLFFSSLRFLLVCLVPGLYEVIQYNPSLSTPHEPHCAVRFYI